MIRPLAAVAIGVLLMTASPAIGQNAADTAAVRAFAAEYEAAWAAKDGGRMYESSRDDVEWVNIVGMHWRGRGEVVAAHDAFLGAMFRNTPITFQDIESVRPIGEDGLVAVLRWSVGSFTTPGGNVVPPSLDRMTLVFERTSQGLRLVHGANVQIDQVATANDPVRRTGD
ncbi:SgcJ/EcaC family oxidoreductase [Brevundimonas sp. VNH65]|uniref:SgcJ/EcaC family oxidoreductase n=1 Tax=Brevundimonas sp. VNH65 TaxID=3400917 RepID=UPI003C0F0277